MTVFQKEHCQETENWPGWHFWRLAPWCLRLNPTSKLHRIKHFSQLHGTLHFFNLSIRVIQVIWIKTFQSNMVLKVNILLLTSSQYFAVNIKKTRCVCETLMPPAVIKSKMAIISIKFIVKVTRVLSLASFESVSLEYAWKVWSISLTVQKLWPRLRTEAVVKFFVSSVSRDLLHAPYVVFNS